MLTATIILPLLAAVGLAFVPRHYRFDMRLGHTGNLQTDAFLIVLGVAVVLYFVI
jgi:hypothetical protein